MKTKIIIADDHLLFAEGLSNILKTEEGIEIAAIVSNGEELMKILDKQDVNLVLLDLSMPKMNGLEAAAQIAKAHPFVKTLVISMKEELEIVRELVEIGVKGILPKNTGKAELLRAINAVMNGNNYYSQRITDRLNEYNQNGKPQEKWHLSKREKEVLQLMYEGLDAVQIGEKLFLSEFTIITHRKRLYEKSKTNKSYLLIKKAIELGYIKEL
ncbi:MAG: response regulator transcription factor [Bacteroidetes bacterium]|nr:response regulator transcription factor [Bacteroidota bacterium]